MKKITALLVSLIMSCAVMAGCSDSSSSSSSKADSTSKAETSAAADESTASEAGTATDLEDTLTAQYTKKIQGESLAIDMTVASEYDNSSAVVEIAGGNMHMKMNFMGVDMDIYNIDGVMYTLDSESKTYYTVDMEESIDDFKSEIGYGINDSYKFISSETTDDGLICETFESTEDPDMELESGVTLDTSDSDDYSFTTTFKYYFNADTKDIVKIETISDGSTTTVTINSFTTENVEVKLPDDFDSWTEQSFDKDTEDIPYDVDGDFRAFEQMKDKYEGNYLANLTGQMSNNGTKYTICIKDGKAYQALTVQGMKSYTVCPGDGKLYNVSEGTTTYSIEDDDGNQWKSADILFGATLDFDHAYIDTTTNVVQEYYNLDSSVSGGEGQIVYGFDGATYDLKQVVLLPEGADESSAVYFTVDSIGEADDSLLAVPDLSAYTKE